MTMADPDFKLAEFGAHTKVILDCIESATDQKPFNRKAARDAIKALGDMLGPGEAQDSETPHDPTHGKQESARGDKAKANDSRRVAYNTDHSIDSIFNGRHDGDGTSVAPSLSEIFGGSPKLGDG
jgi:hypothetical protein